MEQAMTAEPVELRAERASGERLTPQITRKIRDLIMTGQVSGNEKLRTEHLAERFGVSATPVREALMALHGEGMVAFQPGRGFSVVPMTRQDVLDLYDMQAYLSGELAARAATRLTAPDLQEIFALQERLVESVEREQLDITEQVDFEIHRIINRSAASPKLTWALRLTLNYVPFRLYAEIPGWPAAAREDHLPLLRGLSRRSERTARDAMCAHIRNAGDLLVNLLAERGVLVE
jgi:DNA-binding GntR family transcriptional regulator